jgi:hypothetical protein
MLNLKKGLALVLAAATAFTFAPVANLGNAVQAEAAGNEYANTAANIKMNPGETKTYSINKQSLTDQTKYQVHIANTNVAGLQQKISNTGVTDSAALDSDIDISDDFTVVAKQPGETTIEVTYSVAGQTSQSLHSWKITVLPPSEDPAVENYNDAKTDNSVWDVKITAPNDTTTNKINVTRTSVSGVVYQDVTSITSSDETVVRLDQFNFKHQALNSDGTQQYKGNKEETADPALVCTETPDTHKLIGQVPFTALKSGRVQITVNFLTYKYVNGKLTSTPGSIKKDLKVVATKSTLKVDNTEIASGNLTSSSPIVKRIELSADNLTAALGGTFSDAQWVGEGLNYTSAHEVGINGTVNPDANYKDYNSTDLVIDSKAGTVTATAHALSAVEKYYDIVVSNAPLDESAKSVTPTWVAAGSTDTVVASRSSKAETAVAAPAVGEKTKVGIIRIVCKRDASPFTTVTATVNGKTTTAKASYKVDGSIQDDTKEVALQMSTADLTSVPFEATSNLTTTKNFSITSNDPSTVSVENGKLVAHKTGIATITAEAKSDATHYGNATVKVNVSVTAQYINNKVLADATINLNRLNKKAAFNAQVNPATTLTYEFVKKDATGAWVAASDSNLKLDQAAGTVEYTTTAEGSAVVRISGAATNTAAAPAAAYVTVNYTSSKIASKLNVETKSLTIGVGKTGTVVASGTAISFKSNDDSIATVDATTGVVTGVKEGVATITVTDAGNADYQGSSKDVTVYVSGNDETTATPAKVTGVKVTNLKGGKVKVTWTKQNQKNIKYYVKKTVGKKSAGKSVGSNKTTLSVKKGATVKVKVKAYIYNAEGTKLVGSYSKTITKKTDKK